MIECGFCGGGITRRRWNSGTTHQKNIWYCVTAVKKGKKSCPECKGVEESIIENAFVKAFNILCKEQGDIVDSFLKSVEDGLHGKENKKQLNKLNADISSTEIKINKLLDLHLEGKIDKIDYEDKYTELRERLEEMKKQRVQMDTIQDEEKTIVTRINAFRKIFESGKELTEFNRMIEDCQSHKLNIILTKSISRFGRDTVEILEALNQLKQLGVRVIFEQEELDTAKTDSDLMITIIESLA